MARQIIGTNIEGMPLSFLVWNTETLSVEYTKDNGQTFDVIVSVSSNRHPFTSSDLSSNVLTITTTGNVTGVIDDSGKAWNFADEEVTYTDSTVSVDLSGVFARKGIATPTGTWKLMLYGA